MNRFARLQLVGPAAVCAALLACEAASHLLAHAPSSPLAWYLSENLLGMLRNSHRFVGAGPGRVIAAAYRLAADVNRVLRVAHRPPAHARPRKQPQSDLRILPA